MLSRGLRLRLSARHAVHSKSGVHAKWLIILECTAVHGFCAFSQTFYRKPLPSIAMMHPYSKHIICAFCALVYVVDRSMSYSAQLILLVSVQCCASVHLSSPAQGSPYVAP